MKMVRQKFHITQNTRFKSKEPMESGKIEILLGQLTKSKIKTHSYLIVCFGTLLKNSNGLISVLFLFQNRVFVFMNPMWVWLKSLVE